MEIYAGLAMCVMLALALGSIKSKQAEKIRSLVMSRSRSSPREVMA